MRLKSYFAGTVEAAMALARQELGPDAMLVHSRRATAETRNLGEYEVVFALASPSADGASAEKPESPGRDSPREESVARLSGDIADIKKRIERLSGLLMETQLTASCSNANGAARLMAGLLSASVDASLAREIVSRASPVDADREECWPAILEPFVRVDATLGAPGAARKIVAVVGPPGSGKTTTLVKLATTHGIAGRLRTQILTTDIYRIAAAEQLRSYAGILGIGFECIETPYALAQALDEHRRKDLILIDTPGLSECDFREFTDMAEYLAGASEIDVHLVAPLSMRAIDLSRIARRFRAFSPRKILFTRMDETEHYGALLNIPWELNAPASYFTGGPRIPEDLETATARRMIELTLGAGANDSVRTTAA